MHEARFAKPWRIDDAPADYIGAQLKGIVGIELTIEVEASTSSAAANRSVADQDGVVAGLAGSRGRPTSRSAMRCAKCSRAGPGLC
ncbi:MAG: FMN-binding negative transcriptional regulator [Hyphomicrobiaceae bacterium]